MMEQITINDLGVSLQATIIEDSIAVNISTSTAQEIILKKPDGTEVTKTGGFLTDGTDGIIDYSTIAGDIDQKGIWQYRGKITFTASQVYYSEWASFKVVD